MGEKSPKNIKKAKKQKAKQKAGVAAFGLPAPEVTRLPPRSTARTGR